MEIIKHEIDNFQIAEVVSDKIIINTSADGLDLLGNLYYQGFDRVIIYEKNIITDFFNLRNGMAGEILQKFSNYRVRLAIVGSFISYQNKSIKDFIFESNKNKHINFVNDLEQALKVLVE